MLVKRHLLIKEMVTMPTLLVIDSSPLESSISRELTREYVKGWKAKYPAGRVVERDLTVNTPKPVDQAWIGAAYTPEDALTAEQKTLLQPAEELFDELQSADEYVFGVAMHNFSIPSVLKLWIDQVTRRGKTFNYDANGPKGLLKGKKATILIASGGVYESGSPGGVMNFADTYLQTILRFWGVSDVTVIAAGGASQVMTGAVDRETFLKPALERVRSLAA
jgi:FMN-dependent NADH-azoreductase